MLMKYLLLILTIFPALAWAQTGDSLLNALKGQAPSDTARVNTLNALGHAYWMSGEDSLAKIYCLEAIGLAKKQGFLKGEANARFQFVRIEMDILDQVDEAYAHLDTVDRKAREAGDELTAGISFFRRAQLVSMTEMDRPEPVDSLFNLALNIFQKKNSKYWEAMVYQEKAGMLGWEGKYAQSIDLYIKARKILESLGDEKALRATLPNLGVNYTQVEMYKEALECFDKAEQIARKSNDVRVLAFLYNQKGDLFKKQNDLKKALASYTEAAKIYESTASAQFLTSAYARISDVYFKLGDYTRAWTFNQRSDSVFKAHNPGNALYHFTQINYGNLYLQQKKYRDAIQTAGRGLNWIEESSEMLNERSNYLRQLSEAYKNLGNYPLAYDYYVRYKAASDSLLNDESRQRIMASNMNYELDKMKSDKELEIQQLENKQLLQTRNMLILAGITAILILAYILWANRRLRKYNEQLVNKNREIEMALDRGQKIERRRVASELHDNLNTKLAALRWSLESMDTENWDGFNQSLHKKLLEMANEAYKDVRLISHNMLPPELEQYGLPASFTQLTRKLNELGDIMFDFEEHNMYKRLSRNEEHQLYNVALEAINNTLKHAQARHVRIRISIAENNFAMSIRDDGKGIEDTSIRNGMGFHNITNRVESIGGKLQIQSAPGEGTTISVSLPLAG